MPRRHRGHESAPVSLFAFQDAMTCVMAILLMITLLLAIEQTSSTASEARAASTGQTTDSDLRARLESAQTALDQLTKQTEGRSSDPASKLFALRMSLDSLFREIEAAESKLAKDYRSLKEASADPSVKTEIDELLKLQQRAGMLRGELETARLSKRLTYIAGQSGSRTPVLLELSKDAWRFSLSHNNDTAISMNQARVEQRLELLTALLSQVSPKTHYVLIVVKPSGFPHYRPCRESLAALGFKQSGVEAIPEDWTTMVGGDRSSGGTP